MQKHSKFLDNLIKYTLAAVLLIIPLYPKFPLIRIPGTFVSIRLEDLLIAFSGALVLLVVLPNFGRFVKDKLNQSIFLFLLIGLVSLAYSIFVTKTVVSHIGFLHWARRVQYFIPFFLGLMAIRRIPKDLDFYFKLLLIVVLLSFVYGFGQKHFSWPIIITQNEAYSKGVALRWIPGSHINSTFAGHYDLATFLVLVLPIIISSIFILDNMKSRIILLIASFCGLWLLVNTASRISLISYLVATIISLLLIKKHKAIPVVLIISIAFIGLSSNLLARYKRLFEVTINKFQEVRLLNYEGITHITYAKEVGKIIQRPRAPSPTPTPIPTFEDRSTNIRLNVEWPRAIRALSKNPLLGTGYSSITLATDNDYLRMLGEVGVLGFFAFGLIFANIVLRNLSVIPFYKNFKDVELAWMTGTFGALPGLFANAMFIDIFEASKFAMIFWLLMGISLALISHRKSGKVQ